MDASLQTTEIEEFMPTTTEAGLNPEGHKLPNIKTKVDEAVRKKKRETSLDDFNWLIEALDNRDTIREVGPSCSRSMSVDLLRRSAMKRPIRMCSSPGYGVGASESVALKQALRRLSLSQASEMAALKRLSKPVGLSGASEAGTIERLYESVVVRAGEAGNEGKGNSPRLSIVPGKLIVRTSEKMNHLPSKLSVEPSNKTAASSVNIPSGASPKLVRPKIRDIIASPSQGIERIPHAPDESMAKPPTKTRLTSGCDGRPGKAMVIPHSKRSVSNDKDSSKVGKLDSSSRSEGSSSHKPDSSDAALNRNQGQKIQSDCPMSNKGNLNEVAEARNKESASKKADTTPSGSNDGEAIRSNVVDNSRCLEKEECSQSSQSSMGDYSSTTSTSGDSNQSGFSAVGNRPHMSNDVRWRAIRDVEMRQGSISLKNFKLLKRLGCGDIGTVYLAELISSGCLFALKVMDNDFLISRKKIMRAQTEREILQMLDHPFLPTLYTYFTTDNLSCLVMEYCPGGDLHVLRQKQLGRSFSEPAARFYVAEVLLALEYLHMLGVIYRDLKPENILVREDGHIMLSDFDLSLRCSVNAVLLGPSANAAESARLSGACAGSNCIDPLCLRPSCAQYSCFTPHLTSARTRRLKSDHAAFMGNLPQLVVEPTEARSNSFVGTHEYLAPEIIKGEGHGSSVDWWTLGIFLYELLYGRTPFRGTGNEETLANIISQSLWFPDNPAISFRARDLICGLLVKEPENRLGSVRGAAEIKQHPFFHGLNWALIRCATPPETPRPCGNVAAVAASKEVRPNGENTEIEMF